jgi:hypothetical protein
MGGRDGKLIFINIPVKIIYSIIKDENLHKYGDKKWYAAEVQTKCKVGMPMLHLIGK